MLIEDLGADPVVAPAANTGTVPAMPGVPALTYRPIEQARGWYTLYAYSNAADGKLAYYQWTFTPGVRPATTYVGQKPYPPYPPMGTFLTLDSARAAMVAHLNMVSATMPQQPAAPAPVLAAPAPLYAGALTQPGVMQVYRSPFLPTPETAAASAAFVPPPDQDIVIAGVSVPPWAMVATAAGVVGLMILWRRKRGR